MEDIKETQPEITETSVEEEPLLKETKKAKKARTQAQLDAFERARKKRLENINAKKMAKKEQEVAEYKKEKVEIEPVKEDIEEKELTPNAPEYESEEEVKPKPKSKPKPKKKKPKTPPPSESDDSSSSEEEYVIRRRKPTKRKPKVQREEVVEDPLFTPNQNIIFC